MATRLPFMRRFADAVTSRAARKLGYESRTGGFGSPIPDFESLPETLWREPATLHGIDLSIGRALDLLEGELRPYLDEFSGPRGPQASGYQVTGWYGALDSGVLYAMVRQRRPARVVELGSGNSSVVIAHALERNREDGRDAQYRIFDPYPFGRGRSVAVPESAQVDALPAEQVPLASFEELQDSDMLFVDTSHTVKTGGDVVRIVLEVLPVLRAGVVVHFHDIFLPYEYPRSWLMERHRAWAEQYLLQAFLAYNARFEVLIPCHALSRSEPERLRRLLPSFDAGNAVPAALWIRSVLGT